MTKTSAIRVRTRFESVDDFVVGYSPFFDAKGVFIRTRRVQELGTRMRFELQLADGRPVFRGEGTVDEVRQPPVSASGMHVRIAKLDRTSKILFERMTGDLLHVGEDPFEAPTFDPDKPSPLDAEAARLLQGELAPESGEEPRGGPASETEDEEAAAGPGSVVAGPEEPDPNVPLDANLLGEIAEGIEFSLDAVWSGTGGESTGPADLGGYFGSPQVLVEAGLTPAGGQPAVTAAAAEWAPAELERPSEPGSPEWGGAAAEVAQPEWAAEESPVLELGEPEMVEAEVLAEPEVAELGAAELGAAEPALYESEPFQSSPYELAPDDAFNLPSPGEDAAVVIEADDEGEALDLLDEVAESEHGGEVIPVPEVIASGAFDAVPGEAEADLFGVSKETVAVESEDDELGLGLGDHSLAMASNYVPPDDEAAGGALPSVIIAETEPDGLVGEAEVITDDDILDEEVVEAEPAEQPAEEEPPPPLVPRPGEPDLHSLASATLEHDVSHRRYSFTASEKPKLDNLLTALIESTDEYEAPPELDIAKLTGEHEAPAEPGGPDAIDELLARESTAESKGEEKKGLFGRLFGRKKK